MISTVVPLDRRLSHFLEACSFEWPNMKNLLPFKLEMNKLGYSFKLDVLLKEMGQLSQRLYEVHFNICFASI